MLTFAELKHFLLEDMKPQANYQPVMIKTLLENGGRCTKDQIANKLREFNPKETPVKDFKNVLVYSVLESHKVVRKEGDSYVLNPDELTSEQVFELILLCNWLIPDHPLQINELAEVFDRDRNFFVEERPSAEEIEKERKQFVTDFSEQKITTMKLDEYIIGKKNAKTFCYKLEITLNWFGGIKGSHANKFGIFYSKKRDRYVYGEMKYRSAEEAFASIKKQLLTILAAGKAFQADKNWKALSDALETVSDIQSQVKSKILVVYFPNDFLHIHSTQLFPDLLRAIGVKKEEISKNFWTNQAKLLETKNLHPVMKNWTNADFSHFIWNITMERPHKRLAYIFITSYNDTNLQHSIRSKILGWRNRSSLLEQGDYVFVYNSDTRKIQACFRVLGVSDNSQPIWDEELKSQQKQQKLEFPYRWNAEIVSDKLDIDVNAIGSFKPFAGNLPQKFFPLVRNNIPTALNKPEYETFNQFLMNKANEAKDKQWIGTNGIYLLLRTQPDSKWRDEEGVKYHYADTVANHSKISPGARVIFDCNLDGKIMFLGHARISSVEEKVTDKITQNGKKVVEKIAYLQDYIRFDPPKERTSEIEKELHSIDNYNNQNSIREISKQIFEAIVDDRTTKIKPLRNWHLLASTDINEIIQNVLDGKGAGGKKLATKPATVRRIINHLICNKNVVLIGPPGTGKTDLAKRMLRELGLRITGNPDYVEAVASYEWGRYDVIGGNILDKNPDDGSAIFHLGCVTQAISENKFLLIDEFNRADMNKAFGEMFLAIDHHYIDLRADEHPPGLTKGDSSQIQVPDHVRMICTMNDYDKSLLNELSYGLLRRFAFVLIDLPSKDQIKEVVVDRIRGAFDGIDKPTLDIALQENDRQIDCFINFVYEIKPKRTLGVSTIIDVVKYIVSGSVIIKERDGWKLLSEAMMAYVLPQLDRLDIDTLRHVNNAVTNTIKDKDGNTVNELLEFAEKVKEMILQLEELGEMFGK